MNQRLLASLLLSALIAAPALRAQDATPPAPAPAPAAPQKEEKTPLEKDMSKISKAYRALRKQIKDPTKNDSSLELVATMQAGATAAANEVPAKASDLSDTDRPKFLADYQAANKKMLDLLGQLQAALKANDNDQAADLVKQLGANERDAHKEFRRPEKD